MLSWGIQALQRFYEMGESEGELEIAYAKLFTTATDWLSPLADWAIRDAREVGGLPRIYLSSQPVRPANESCRCCFTLWRHSIFCGGSSSGVGVCPRAAARALPRPFDLREVRAEST